MLSIINPSTMALNMNCCPSAPYCSHGQRPMQSQALPPLGIGSTGEGSSWNNRISQHHQPQYSFNRPPHTTLFPSQHLSYLNSQDKLRSIPSTYSTPPLQTTTWATPGYPILSNDFANTTWFPNRNKDNLHSQGPPPFPYDSNEYIPSIKYEGLELRDVSPSRATDFSTVSASSQASPAPATAFMGYGGMRISKDDSPFLSSHPLPPEQLRAAEHEVRRMSSVSFDSNSPSKLSRSRSRKGSEPIHCHICLKSFDRRSNFKSHWETHDKDRQRTVCKIDGCNKTFGRPAEMTRHVNSAHRQKSFPCSSCGKEFTRHDILLRHCKDACPVLVKGKGSGKKRRSKNS